MWKVSNPLLSIPTLTAALEMAVVGAVVKVSLFVVAVSVMIARLVDPQIAVTSQAAGVAEADISKARSFLNSTVAPAAIALVIVKVIEVLPRVTAV